MRLHYLLPFRRLTFETSLSPEEAADLLARHVGKRSWNVRSAQLEASDCAYRGWVSPQKFKILRNLGHRDGWQPVVRGKLQPAPFGTKIRVTMRLMIPGYCAAVLLLFATALLAVAIIAAAIGEGRLIGLAVLAVYVVGHALILRSFWLETLRTQHFLHTLFPPARLPMDNSRLVPGSPPTSSW